MVEDGDLILTSKANADDLLAVANGNAPSALDHPLRAELARDRDGFRPAAIGFIDMASLSPEDGRFRLGRPEANRAALGL